MKNALNIEKIEKSVDKLKFYDRSENENFADIVSELINLSSFYNGDNSDYFTQIVTDIEKKFNVIKANHYNNEVILMNALNKYSDVSKSVSKMFREI